MNIFFLSKQLLLINLFHSISQYVVCFITNYFNIVLIYTIQLLVMFQNFFNNCFLFTCIYLFSVLCYASIFASVISCWVVIR